MKNVLSLCLIALLFVSCSKKSDDEITPVADKKVKIEIDLSGNYQNFQLLFALTTLTTSNGAFVVPEFTIPANTAWTQVIAQANAYNYVEIPTSSKMVIESKAVAGKVSFTLSAAQVDNGDDTTQIPLKAVVKVYGDGKLIQTYTHQAVPVGQVVSPLTVELDLSK